MQNELAINIMKAYTECGRKYSKSYVRLLLNTWYGATIDDEVSKAHKYRVINTIFTMSDITPLSKTASFDSVSEWDCMIFKRPVSEWLGTEVRDAIDKSNPISVAISSTTAHDFRGCWFPLDFMSAYIPYDIILEYTYAVWKHDDKFEMYDRNVAPRGFNRRGFPTPSSFDVLTYKRLNKKEHTSLISSRNAFFRDLLWEQECENNETV